ncbi:LemA family protein [Kaistella sp. G5-32]|uniref:LemA family protein n=2 Tax=Kaistella gelatinilytica TaxID=2787636 RepID=A0ABS0F770_9FLAO|nr:LemA family protein [Kaistella gelatinilytica]
MNNITSTLIIIILSASFLFYVIGIYNKLVMLKNNVEKAFSNIDVILKQRADEIPNLVSVVKGYKIYEQELLTKLVELRSSYATSQTSNEKTMISNNTSKALSQIFAVSENYPELLANKNFLELQFRISNLEDIVADRREFFNENISIYNIAVKEFPTIIFAKLFNYREKNFLKI